MNESTSRALRSGGDRRRANGHLRTARQRQCGFTLVELMVSITIAVFLLGGLLATVQGTRQAYGNQTLLAQLQDNQRLALTLMADVIEAAGYYPSPVSTPVGNVLPAGGVFATAGQPMFGVSKATAQGDTITVRYGAALNDNVISCVGGTNTATAPYDTFVSTFHVNANNQLACQSTTAAGTVDYVLVNGVENLTVEYGVKRNPVDTGSCADTYLKANQMAAADWTNVCSVSVSVTFTNPLNPPGVKNAPITISTVIAVMGMAGVNS